MQECRLYKHQDSDKIAAILVESRCMACRLAMIA
jgi:hypothetical protein